MLSVTLRIDPTTWQVLSHVAASYHMSAEALASQMLYRDCASMSGWPGNLGAELRRILVDAMYPAEDADVADVADYEV